MAPPRDDSPPSRIELVVLACLSQRKSPGDAALGAAVHELALPNEQAAAARLEALRILKKLVDRGWVTSERSPRKLTPGGERALRTVFNLTAVPSWIDVRDQHFASLALGVPAGSALAKAACKEPAIVTAVLAVRFGVCDARELSDVCDAIVADTLGMPRGKMTLARIRAHVLAREVEKQAKGVRNAGSHMTCARLAMSIACATVDVSPGSRKKHKMARAVACRWVCRETHLLGERVFYTVTSDVAPETRASESVPPNSGQIAAPLQPPAIATPATAQATAPAQSSSPPQGRIETSTPPTAQPPRPRQPASPPSQPPRPGVPMPPQTLPPRPVPSDAPVAPDKPPPSPDLLEAVREAIPRVGAEGRFGEKVYVSAIWRSIERDRKGGDLSLDHFKNWLLTASRAGSLVLARADLIGAMDAKQVTESEINDRGTTFHFVLDQRNGSSAQRGNHVG